MKYMKYVIYFSLSVLISVFLITNIVMAEDQLTADEYIEIKVEAGDTLWTIAKPYYDGKSDYREYLYNIRELNNLDQGVIYPGQTIKIPL